jgi:short-subunit dehydrogenase
MKNLNGKVAVVTGAGSGIGRELCRELYKEGCFMAAASLHEKNLEETADFINPDKKRYFSFVLDVSKREQVENFAAKTMEYFGRVDIVINNAGVSLSGKLGELSYKNLEWIIGVNLWGVVYGSKAFLPYLLKRKEANIVNISSVFGLIGIPELSAYCMTKFGVRGFSEALRVELKNTPVKVTVVFPGGIKTNIAKNSRTDSPSSDYNKKTEAFEKTLVMSPVIAAQIIIDGIKKNKPRLLIGKDARKIDFLARINPGNYDSTVLKTLGKILS